MNKLSIPHATEIADVNKPVFVYLSGLTTKQSRKTTKRALDVAANFVAPGSNAMSFKWHTITHEDLVCLRAHLAQTRAPKTANRILSAIKQVLRASFRLRMLSAEDLQHLVDIGPVRGSRLKRGRALSLEEVRAMVNTARQNRSVWRGTRNACMLGLLFASGLRRAELAGLTLAHLSRDNQTSRYVLRVLGKGNKEREVPLPLQVNVLLERWLRIRGGIDGALFPPNPAADNCFSAAHMNPENIRILMGRIVRACKLQHASPHDFRRTFISELLDRTNDPSTVQALAGHANVQTTLQYDRRGERAKARVVDSLEVPFA